MLAKPADASEEAREWIQRHAVQPMRAKGTDPADEGVQRARVMRMNKGPTD